MSFFTFYVTVFLKTVPFSVLIDFIEYSKGIIKDSICERYNILDARDRYDYKLLIESLNWARVIRNSCAHNERVYMVKQMGKIIERYHKNLLPNIYIKEKNKKLIDLIVYMKYYLCTSEYSRLLTDLKKLLNNLKKKIPDNSFDYVRAQLGIENLEHLVLLDKFDIKEIYY